MAYPYRQAPGKHKPFKPYPYVQTPQAPPRFRPFKPYVTPQPPAGSYDPALDAQRAAATRGLRDTRSDVSLAGIRSAEDFQFGQDQINRGYQTNTAMLKRQFDILAGRQQEQAAGSQVYGGGALLQAAAKRAANQKLQQDQLNADRSVALGRLGVEQQRGITDRTTSLSRAEREDTAFGLDVGAQRAFQAAQAGYTPPQPGQPGGMPRNMFLNRHGRQRERIVRGGHEYIVAPDGTVVHRRRVRR